MYNCIYIHVTRLPFKAFTHTLELFFFVSVCDKVVQQTEAKMNPWNESLMQNTEEFYFLLYPQHFLSPFFPIGWGRWGQRWGGGESDEEVHQETSTDDCRSQSQEEKQTRIHLQVLKEHTYCTVYTVVVVIDEKYWLKCIQPIRYIWRDRKEMPQLPLLLIAKISYWIG